MDMAKCPVCLRQMKTPFALRVDTWRWLKCPHCGARLEQKHSRWLLSLTALYLCLLALGRLGRFGRWYVGVVEGATVVTAVAMIALLLRPGLQARKALPEPEVALRIDSNDQSKR